MNLSHEMTKEAIRLLRRISDARSEIPQKGLYALAPLAREAAEFIKKVDEYSHPIELLDPVPVGKHKVRRARVARKERCKGEDVQD